MKYLLNEYHSNDRPYIITNYQKASRSGVYIFKLRVINIVNRRVGEIERCGICALLEHFQEKWNPFFHPKVRAKKLDRARVHQRDTRFKTSHEIR
jgi:hypothetical protein